MSFKVNIGGTKNPAEEQTPEAAPATPTPSTGGTSFQPSWLKKGADAEKGFEEQTHSNETIGGAIDRRKAMVWDFWLREGEEHRITFLDGHLSTDPNEEGRLLYPAFRMHTVRNPRYTNQFDSFVCLSEEDTGCPLCENDDNPVFVAPFPVIDHTKIMTKKGEVQNVVKLYLAKSITIKMLQKKAGKFQGLAYQTFDVSRTDKKMARVGDQMEHIQSVTLEALQKRFPELNLPLGDEWYAKNLPYFSREEIIAMGHGSVEGGPSAGAAPGGPPPLPGGGNDGAIGAQVPADDDLPF